MGFINDFRKGYDDGVIKARSMSDQELRGAHTRAALTDPDDDYSTGLVVAYGQELNSRHLRSQNAPRCRQGAPADDSTSVRVRLPHPPALEPLEGPSERFPRSRKEHP